MLATAHSKTQEMPSLRILMVAPQPFFRPRGTPFSVLHRIRALVAGGHSVDLITYPFGEDIALPGLHIIRSACPPLIRDIKIGPSLAKLVLDFPLYWRTIQALRQNEYDVLHSHEEAAFFSMGLAKRYKLPHIYDMHSSLPQQLGNFKSFNLSPIRSVFSRLEQRVLLSCDGIITICNELAEVVDKHVPDKPHSMIENTADDTKVFKEVQTDIKVAYGLKDNQIILYTGTFESYQGLDLLIDAFSLAIAKLPGIRLLLVGGNQEQVKTMQVDIKRRGLSEKIIMTGTVHPSKIPAFLQAADMIVSPRCSGTNTPLKIYGYLRSGKALVATDKLTHTQILNSDICHLVPATSNGLAEGIVKVSSQPDYAKKIGESGKQFAETYFSDDEYIRKVLDLYSKALHRKVPTSNGVLSHPNT